MKTSGLTKRPGSATTLLTTVLNLLLQSMTGCQKQPCQATHRAASIAALRCLDDQKRVIRGN